MKFIYTKSITLQTDLSADQIRDKLLQNLETKRVLWSTPKRYEGKLVNNAFTMRRFIRGKIAFPWPFIDGTIRDQRIELTFRYNFVKTSLKALFLFWGLFMVPLLFCFLAHIPVLGSPIDVISVVIAGPLLIWLMLLGVLAQGRDYRRLITWIATERKFLVDYFEATIA